MNDIESIVHRLQSLRDQHREHAIVRIERLLEAVEQHQARFSARVTVPMGCPPGV